MWHASVASHVDGFDVLESYARRMLTRVGDAGLGQWIQRRESGGMRIVHLRRRVSTAEEKRTGPALDIRGTAEMFRRLQVVSMYSRTPLQQLVDMEARQTAPAALQGIEPVD